MIGRGVTEPRSGGDEQNDDGDRNQLLEKITNEPGPFKLQTDDESNDEADEEREWNPQADHGVSAFAFARGDVMHLQGPIRHRRRNRRADQRADESDEKREGPLFWFRRR